MQCNIIIIFLTAVMFKICNSAQENCRAAGVNAVSE